MTVRRAVTNDIDRLIDLLCQVLDVHHNARPDIFRAGATKYTESELTEILKDDQRPIFVCEDDEHGICGYVFCVFVQHKDNNILTDIKTLYIDDLCVDSKFRGKGIGKVLYNYAVDFAKENIDAVGEYLYPLSDDFVDSNILEIRFSVRRKYRSRTKFEFMLGIKCRDVYDCTGMTSYMEQGTLDEIYDAINKPDIAIRYLEVLFRGLQDHYFSAL